VYLEVGVHELEDEVEAPLVREHVQQADDVLVGEFLEELDLAQGRHVHAPPAAPLPMYICFTATTSPVCRGTLKKARVERGNSVR